MSTDPFLLSLLSAIVLLDIAILRYMITLSINVAGITQSLKDQHRRITTIEEQSK